MSTGYSWTRLKITKLCIAPQWNGALCIVLFGMRIFVTQIQSLDRRTTWRPSPFSGGTPEETWTNLKKWTKVLRRPEYDKPEDLIFNLTDIAWDAITRYGCSRELPNMPFLMLCLDSLHTQARGIALLVQFVFIPSSKRYRGMTFVVPRHLSFLLSTLTKTRDTMTTSPRPMTWLSMPRYARNSVTWND